MHYAVTVLLVVVETSVVQSNEVNLHMTLKLTRVGFPKLDTERLEDRDPSLCLHDTDRLVPQSGDEMPVLHD